MESAKQHIVVVGGGFAGLNFIRQLHKNPYYTITLVDKNNYNYFTPLLYQVATGFLEPASISYPFRKLFHGKNIHFRMAALLEVNPAENSIRLDDGTSLSYDLLVLATGTTTNFFGNTRIEKKALSLKGIDDALYMRNQLIKTLERAAVETDRVKRKQLLSVVVAGGGPTGVEIAGMLAEFRKYIMAKDYPELQKEDEGNIYIIDGASTLLAHMSDKTHQDAFNRLQQLGVHIRLNTLVTNFDNGQVQLSDGTHLEAQSLIWAAGVIASSVEGISENFNVRSGRILTDQFNCIWPYRNVYAIGDLCVQFHDPRYLKGHPQLAQPAIQQGKHLAKNFIRAAQQKPMKPFRYFDRGEMAIIGRNFAVADLLKHKLHIGGLLGLLSWLFIHVVSLINYNNRIKTLYGWTIAYLTRDQFLRMIFHAEKKTTGKIKKEIVKQSI